MKIELKGEYDIVGVDKTTGKEVFRKHYDNLLTQYNLMARDTALLGTYIYGSTGFQIKYFAFGDGTATPTVNDTQLANERYRKQVTQLTSPQTGKVSSVCSVDASEANFTIKEVGVFVGTSATETANTGILLSRVLVDIPNNPNIILNFYRTDTCTIGG